MKKTTVPRLYVITVLVSMTLFTGCGIMSKIEETKNLEINTPDLKKIKDGSYEGSYDGGPVKVVLDVRMENHVIKEVILKKHECGKGEAAESLVDSIVQAQSLNIDAITGATVSSKAILKAAENALKNALP